MAEIQETSDATFRLFDWNRVDAQGESRKLHIEEAFAAIHWEYGPVQSRRVPQPMRPGFYSLAKSASFELDYVFATDKFGASDVGQLKAIIVLEGDGRWRSGERIAPGQVWVLPTSSMINHMDLTSPLRAVLATLP